MSSDVMKGQEAGQVVKSGMLPNLTAFIHSGLLSHGRWASI
jgi:hypothetical protein